MHELTLFSLTPFEVCATLRRNDARESLDQSSERQLLTHQCARGFSNTTIGSCAYTTRSRAVGTVHALWSNADIWYTSSRGEERRTVGEMESLDELRTGLPAIPGG